MENELKISVVVWHNRDETPKKDGFYIVAFDNTTTVAEFNRGNWIVYGGYFTYFMTAWAELPKLKQDI